MPRSPGRGVQWDHRALGQGIVIHAGVILECSRQQGRSWSQSQLLPSAHPGISGGEVPPPLPPRIPLGAYRLKKGHLRVKVVSALIAQHQVVSSIDEDPLETNQGAQEPVASAEEAMTMMGGCPYPTGPPADQPSLHLLSQDGKGRGSHLTP